jgi:hypothetical protein
VYNRIDLVYLRKQGWLEPSRRYSLGWTMGDEPSGRIQYLAYANYLLLDFKVREYDEEKWTPVRQTVHFDQTPTHFGGQRRWFLCPGCDRRCRILYGGARFFCRKCYRLSYRSQSEDSAQRAISRTQATRRRLGGSESIDDYFPPKPKGMHWKTYNRLVEADEEAARRADAKLMGFFARLQRFKR